MNYRRVLYTSAVAAAAMVGGAMPQVAFAQQAPAAASDDADIVVTARKREEDLQRVPLAIDAFSAKEIKDAKIERLSDLAKLAPGLNYTPLFGAQNQLPIIRGAAQTFGQLNVGVFLDGIYLSGKAAADLELNDLERVEIVKGPQSALYGRNTFAGAINYITKRPSEAFEGEVEATFGEHGLFKTQASVSGPISDSVRVRVGGFVRSSDGWYKSAIDGGKVDFVDTYGGIVTVEYAPTDRFTATLRLSGSDEDSGQPAANVVRTNAFPNNVAGPGTTRNRLYVGEVPALGENAILVNTVRDAVQIGDFGQRSQIVRGSVDLSYDFQSFNARSVTSYSHRTGDYTFDGDNTLCQPGPCFNFGPPIAAGSSRFALSSADESFVDISQELRLTSTTEGPVDWILGAFYYSNDTTSLNRSLSPVTAAARNTFAFGKTKNETRSVAVFGSLGYDLTERLTVNGEVRYEREEQDYAQRATNPLGTLLALNLSNTFEFVTPRVTLDYKLSDDTLLYGTIARGAKTGGFNSASNITTAQRPYNPEYSVNYELGAKTEWLDGRARLNASAYYVDWKDQQAACQNPGIGATTNRTYTCNAGEANVTGLELDGLFKFTKAFSVSGAYAYTNAEYTKFLDDSLNAVTDSLGQPRTVFDGKSLPYVPEHKFTVSPNVRFPVAEGLFAFGRADFSYQSKSYVRADNLQSFGEKTVVDLRAGVESGRWRLQAFADNVFDDDTPVAAVRFFDSVNFSVAAPLVFAAPRRQIGASLTYRFGGS
jgi:iron complex outermembrane receptor protein